MSDPHYQQGSIVVDPQKRIKLKHDWAPDNCSVIIAPVFSPKNKGATFAFPVDLIYDNLASLFGFIQNPWTTTKSAEEEGHAPSPTAPATTKGKENGGKPMPAPSSILRDLCVTPEMCSAYVKYRRMGVRGDECLEFMIRAAAPAHFIEKYQFQKDGSTMLDRIYRYVNRFDSIECHDEHDKIQYFADWNDYSNSSAPTRLSGGAYIRLHDTEKQIDELRKRMRYQLRHKEPTIFRILNQRNPKMENLFIVLMREQTLCHYNVPLLIEGEEV